MIDQEIKITKCPPRYATGYKELRMDGMYTPLDTPEEAARRKIRAKERSKNVPATS